MPANAIHKNSVIPESVHLGYGNFINAGVFIGSGSKLSNPLHSTHWVNNRSGLSGFKLRPDWSRSCNKPQCYH